MAVAATWFVMKTELDNIKHNSTRYISIQDRLLKVLQYFYQMVLELAVYAKKK